MCPKTLNTCCEETLREHFEKEQLGLPQEAQAYANAEIAKLDAELREARSSYMDILKLHISSLRELHELNIQQEK